MKPITEYRPKGDCGMNNINSSMFGSISGLLVMVLLMITINWWNPIIFWILITISFIIFVGNLYYFRKWVEEEG